MENNNFTILERKLGGKSVATRVTPKNTIKSVDVSNELKGLFCLNDELVLRLCEIGALIQGNSGGSSRDIEWAVQNVMLNLRSFKFF